MNQSIRKVDHSVLRTNQAIIIGLLLAAFISDAFWLAAFVTLVMLYGTLITRKAGFAPIYFRVFKPARILKPDVIEDNPEPHLFAQGFGGVVMLIGTFALYFGAPIIGWALVWLVIFLAALNLFVGFCAGCMVYYWLNRIGAPGFTANPLPGVFPGMRPH
ncbi:MAG: DUF4395 domain-containing protein [Chloroflexi bacterium]|nr:DUF4395 domain-containing protein [Chloroflexota bacterium]MBI3742011.1 DUF4395 domain-containing protein [Chloroflexota bacterium]